MQALITAYLIQKKECDLPLIGHFRIKARPADFAKTDRQIFPPSNEILYNEFAANLSGELITYISALQNITAVEAEGKIINWCQYAREKLDLGEEIIFNSLGSLQKDAVGNIFFKRSKGPGFYEVVSAEKVRHENAEHSLLVGDRETTSVVMNEFYREEVIEKKIWWKIWAIVLLAVSLLVLFFYFYTYKFSETGIGNRASFSTQNPPESYHSP